MGRINWGRVILGGIAAGIVINFSEYLLNDVILRKQLEAAMTELGKSPEQANVAVWIVYGFVLGIAAVWLYAAIRPRYGPGAGTALKAGFTIWVLAYLLSTVAMLNMQFFPTGLLMTGLIWGLVEVLIATVIGAWVYREA
jgi:hypothetical protein